MRTESNIHPNLYDIVWTLYENNHSHQGINEQVLNMVTELDLLEIVEILKSVNKTIERERPRSIKFALLLSFKRMFLDCLLKTLTTDKFKDIVPYLHPMECVYLIISSLSLQTHDDMETSEWFTNDFGQAYNIFVYIVRWMNWKVDESVGDEFYYETYFHDYGKMERKRVMSTVGADMLKFILAYPKSHIAIVESLPEIVPLLESEHLLTFWLFMQKLMEKNVGQPLISMGTFYDSLSYVQLQCYLLGSTTSPTSSTRISIASSHQTKKIEVDHLHDFQESLLDYIASRFKVSTENGDSFFGDKNFVILSGKIYPECIEMVDSVVNSAPDSLPPLISLVSRMENESDVLNLVNSRAFAKKEAIVKTLITYWAVYPHLKALHKPHTGCLMRTVFIKVLMEEMYKEISDKDLLKKIESLGSEIS